MQYREASSRHSQPDYSPRSYGWRLHAGILTFVLLVFALDVRFPGWGEPIIAAGAGIGVAILSLRRLWKNLWFWAGMGVMIALHVPLVITIRPVADRYQFLFALPFAIMDLIFLVLIFNGLFPRE
jgi:hypothetical protein